MKKAQPIFRYAGGKSRLGKKILDFFPESFENYYEPFVGGGGMLLNIINKYPNLKHIYINDLDENMYSFWYLIIKGDDIQLNTFLNKLNIVPTVELFKDIHQMEPQNMIEKAYKALFLNKTSFSGLGNYPIGGWKQTGKYLVDCRFNYKRIVERCLHFRNILRHRSTVTNLTFQDFFQLYDSKNSICYLDPPYYDKGKTLYPVFMEDKEHIELANILHRTQNWILSYDKHPVITELYQNDIKHTVMNKKSITVNTTKRDELGEYVIIPQKKT